MRPAPALPQPGEEFRGRTVISSASMPALLSGHRALLLLHSKDEETHYKVSEVIDDWGDSWREVTVVVTDDSYEAISTYMLRLGRRP